MPAVIRKGVDFSAGHCFVPRPASEGSPNVFVGENQGGPVGAAVRAAGDAGPGDLYPAHNCGDNSHEGRAAGGSPTVIVNGNPITRIGDDIDCGDVAAAGSPTVMVGDESFAFAAVVDKVMYHGDDLDDGSPAGRAEAEAYIQSYVDQGVLEVKDLDQPIKESEKDVTPAPPVQVAPSGDCTGFETMQFPDSFQLTALNTLGQITKKVIFPHQVVANMGLPLHQIVCNLKMLTLNCWEPIKAQYPAAYITNSFRANQGKSQHNIGQAMDIQFGGVLKSQYFSIAQWIKENVNFDQLLLEYKTTGTKLPWIHVSFKLTGNRKQVLTLMNDKTHSQGLVNLA